jgi:hypothetical protein
MLFTNIRVNLILPEARKRLRARHGSFALIRNAFAVHIHSPFIKPIGVRVPGQDDDVRVKARVELFPRKRDHARTLAAQKKKINPPRRMNFFFPPRRTQNHCSLNITTRCKQF